MFTWGLNVVAIKYLVAYFPPVAMQASRIFVAGVVALIALYFLKDLRQLTRQEWFYILLAAVLGQLAHHSLLAIGLVETSASNAAIILGLIPLTTSVLAIIFLHDRLTWTRLVGILLGFTGVSMVVLQTNGGIGMVSRGDLFVFISMLAQACSFIIIKKVTATLSSKQMTAVMLLVGSVMLLGLSLWIEPQGVQQLSSGTTMVWTVLLTSAVIATGLGHIFFNMAISHIGAGQTAIFNNLVPFFSLIGAFFFLGESIVLTQIAGFIVIVLGVLLGTGYVDTLLARRKENALAQAAQAEEQHKMSL